MTNPVFACSHVWAVTQDGALRYAPANNPSWQKVVSISSPVVALAACETHLSIYAACKDGTLHSFHPETAQLQLSAPNPLHDLPRCLLALPLDNALFVGLQDGSLVRLHLSSLAFDCMLGAGVEHSAPINAIDADSKFLYTAGNDGVVLVWDLHDANAVCEISMPSAPVTSILRVDAALWIGLSTGAVEILDIFGDDMNSIDRICQHKPHDGPVTNLLHIGENEVWSIGASTIHSDEHYKPKPKIAIWDARDFTYTMADEHACDVTSAVVINRDPFEDVSILTLTNSLGSRIISKRIKGLISIPPEEGAETMELFISDLESQLQQANAEIETLKSGATSRGGQSSGAPSTQGEAASESDHEPALSTEQQLFTESERTANMSEVNNSPMTPTRRRNPRVTSGGIPVQVAGALNSSLTKLSELLVSMLSDEVIATKEADATQNGILRQEIASVTKEINFARDLVSSCDEATPNTMVFTSVEETGPTTPSYAEKSATIESSIRELRKRLDQEIEKNRILEKDLSVVSKERDLCYEDLQAVKSQSESTLTSLEGILREKTNSLESKESDIEKLRNECKQLHKKLSEENRKSETAKKKMLEEIESLSNAAGIAAKTYDNHLTNAYERLETKSVEVQQKQDSLRTAQKQINLLKEANQTLQDKCNDLATAVTKEKQHSAQREISWQTIMESRQHEHDDELSKLKLELSTRLQEVQQNKDALHRSADNARDNFVTQLNSAEQELDLLRKDWETARTELETIRGVAATKEAQYEEIRTKWSENQEKFDERVEELSIQLQSEQTHRLQLTNERDELNTELTTIKRDLEEMKREKENIQATVKSEVQNSSPKENSTDRNLEAELSRIQEENKLYEQELNHRHAAEKVYAKETERMKSVISNLKDVSQQLTEKLSKSDQDKENLSQKIAKMTNIIQCKEERIIQLEKMPRSIPPSPDTLRRGIAQDMSVVTEALLASAKGEIEQMSSQIDAMNRAHTAQEKELGELRYGIRSRDQLLLERESVLRKIIAISKNPSKLQASLRLSPIMDCDGLRAINEGNSLTYEEYFDPSTLVKAEDDLAVNDTLQDLQEGMVTTKERLKDLSGTARRYKRFAQSHLDILPALYAVEGELIRISGNDKRQGENLASARGIVQSVIAQYYTSAEKRAVISREEQELYEPSRKRQDALDQIVLSLRGVRKNDAALPNVVSKFRSPGRTPRFKSPAATYIEEARETDSTRRYLTFN